MNTRVRVLCLAAALTLFGAQRLSRSPAPAAMQPGGRLLAYAGRFAESEEYRDLVRKLPAMLERATETAASALGLSVDPLRWRLRLVDDSLRMPWTEHFVARTVTGAHGPATIELRLEPLLAGRIDVAGTLTHEAAHAVLAQALGSGYSRLPEWLREGIAVDVAGETEHSLSRAISLTAVRPVEKIADGLSRMTHGASDYGESGLAMETLRSLAGEDAVPRLVSCLASAGEWRSCLHELTGLNPKQFEARTLLDTLEAIGSLAGDRVSTYESARGRLGQGDPAGALVELERLLQSGPGPFDREARLESARALALLDRPQEALEQTEAFFRLGDYQSQLGIDALVLAATVSRRAGLEARAEKACRTLRLYYARDGDEILDACARPGRRAGAGGS